MKLTRTRAGRYYTVTPTHTYLAVRNGRIWRLTIAHTLAVAGVTITDPNRPPLYVGVFETIAEARAVVEEYHALGDGYQQSEHGHRSRPTEAIQRAYRRLAAR